MSGTATCAACAIGKHAGEDSCPCCRIVIHRDSGAGRWFLYGGHRFTIGGGNANGGNEGWGYEVWDESGHRVADHYFTLADIREQFPGDFPAWLDDQPTE